MPKLRTLEEITASSDACAQRLYGRQKAHYHRACQFFDLRAEGLTDLEIAETFSVSFAAVRRSIKTLRGKVRYVLKEEPTFFDDKFENFSSLIPLTKGEAVYEKTLKKHSGDLNR